MEESDAVCDMASSAVCVRKKQEKKKKTNGRGEYDAVCDMASSSERERGKKKVGSRV